MVLFTLLGTSCFDVYQLINICIPTLTREVVKQRQKKSVNQIAQTVKSAYVAAKQFVADAASMLFTPASAQAFA